MDSLVSTDWLAAEAGADDLVIVDASWHLPDAKRDAAAEYAAAHIPGARFLDLATLVDAASPIDNTMPDAAAFAARMASLGIGDTSRVIVYDDSAVRSATRAWYMLRLFGAKKVAVLDGGLAKWKAEGRPLASGAEPPAEPAHFTPKPQPAGLRDKAEVLEALGGGEQIVDARGLGRFTGDEQETRPGLASGHIPGARHLHYAKLYEADGTLRSPVALENAFTEAGVDLVRPVVTSCGSGMTACILAFALHQIGKTDVALYDGSWAEWGADPATPKATGPA